MKKVVFLCTNDLTGGAAIVTYRLMEALAEAGTDARMVTAHKSSASERVSTVGKWRYRLSFLAERLDIFIRSGFRRADLWKADTARFGCGITRHPWVKEADVVILSWVNQGLVSLKEIRRMHAMGKRILWTMHDMWCCTGICHHSETCTRFEGECGKCPLLGSRYQTDLSTQVQKRKRALYSEVPVTFIPVSNWLAGECRRSSLMRDASIKVVPNALPIEKFSIAPATERSALGLPEKGDIIVFAAARIDDPIKNLPLAIAALNRLHDMRRGAPGATVIFCGGMKDPAALDRLRFPHLHAGPVAPEKMAQIFAHATVVLSTSVRETLPGTLIEGMAAGATPVTTGHGGQADIIEHGKDGYICTDDDPDTLAGMLDTALSSPFSREAEHAAMRRFSAPAVADEILRLING